MRKLGYMVLLLALVLPMAIPFASVAAQADPVVAALEAYNANLPAGYGNVTVTDLSVELIDKPDLLLVDVRQPDEYAAGHIPGAFNIPLRDLAKNLNALPEMDAEIVVYCGSAFRSSMAMTSLQILGYSNVRNMAGGFKAWEGEEFAVTTDATEAVLGEAPAVDADVLAAVDAQLSGLPEGWGGVSAENLNVELIENAPDLLVDVRTPEEWAADGYIAGAVAMPLEELMSHVGELPEAKDANIVVYCKSGHRGNIAATILRTLGYTNVRNLSGGFGAWTTAGLPVEQAEATPATEGASSVVAALEAYNANLPAGYGNVTVTDLSVELIDKPDLLLVDVRQPDEYAAGHIPGAFNIPLRDLAKNLNALPEMDAEIVVYCGSAFRSSMAMTSLQILGYSNVRNMAGGFKAWEGEEFAVTTDVTEAVLGEAPAVDADVLTAVDAQLSGLPEGWGGVSAENLNVELIENAPDLLVDVRTPEEWAADGYIAGAVAMPLEELMSHVGELPEAKDANIVVYCKSGHRGNIAATILRTLGYTNVRNLSGGFGAWTTAGLPVEKD